MPRVGHPPTGIAVPHADVPAHAGHARPRRGYARLGRQRQGIPRLRRRHRDRHARARPSGTRRRHCRASAQVDPRLQHLLQRAPGSAGPVARGELGVGPGVLRELRRGGERGRHQACPEVGHQPPQRRVRDHRDAQRLPWAHDGQRRRHRNASLPGAVRPGAPRLLLRRLWRSGRAEGGHHGQDMRHPAGAHPGGGGRERASG